MEILRLKEILKEKGVTGKELATDLNVTENSISLIANNKRLPRAETLLKIASYLDVDLRELFISTKESPTSQKLFTKDENGNYKEVGSIDI